MEEIFKIYISHLADGQTHSFKEEIDPNFLDVSEKDLSFRGKVKIEGKADLVDANLVLTLKIETEATLPCAICNESTQIPISIPTYQSLHEVSNLKNGVFNYKDLLRETILLEVPQTAECSGANCPEREKLTKYFASDGGESKNETNPFWSLS